MSGVVGRFDECAGVLLYVMTWKRVLWARYTCESWTGARYRLSYVSGWLRGGRTVPLTARCL